MDEKTKQFIEKHINKIVEEFNFKNRKIKNPNDCPCYTKNKPCHNISEEKLNCFLCYCPEYNNAIPEGGCKINSTKGKWFFHEKLPKGKIWDCSDCDYPHHEESARKYLNKLFGLK